MQENNIFLPFTIYFDIYLLISRPTSLF